MGDKIVKNFDFDSERKAALDEEEKHQPAMADTWWMIGAEAVILGFIIYAFVTLCMVGAA